MISSTQLEAFYERVPNILSMQVFCSVHNVPYNYFELWETALKAISFTYTSFLDAYY